MTISITSKTFDPLGNTVSQITVPYEDHAVGEESWANLIQLHKELGHGLHIGDHTHLVWDQDSDTVIAFAEKKVA